MKKTASGITIAILLIGMLTLAFNIQQAKSLEPPVLEWDREYGGADHDGAYCMVQTDDGGYALAGYTLSFGAGSYDIWLVKTDAEGNVEPGWPKTYGGASEEGVHSLVQTDDGGYALAGATESFGAGGFDFWLIKVDSSGNMEWNHTYGGTQDDAALSMIQTDDGGYALAGKTKSFGAGAEDFWLVKTNSTGHMEWNQPYGEAYDDWAFSVIQTSDEGFAMTGWTSPFGAGERDVWLVKTNSTGHMEWNQTYGETGREQGNSVIQTHDGGYAIAGHTESFGARRWDWLLLRTDSSGNLLGEPNVYGGPYDDYGQCILQTSDHGYMIAGYTQVSSVGGSFDGWLIRTDSTGEVQWDQTFGEADVRDEFKVVIETADGGYALAGAKGGPAAGGSEYFDFWLTKLAPVHEYHDLIEEYFPYWSFSKDEAYYPCSFYFDNDADVTDNKDDYESSTFADPQTGYPPYYVYVHVVEDETYLEIQYWLYYVYNDHPKALMLDHDHEWDSTIFIDFLKSDLTPVKVWMNQHLTIQPYSWSDLEKKDDTHLVAYVAEGSHGVYSSKEEANSGFDEWELGGSEMGVDDLNWYIVGDFIEHTEEWIDGELKTFCVLEIQWVEGTGQSEPIGDGYWPHKWVPLLIEKITRLESPWHRPQWQEVQTNRIRAR